MTRYGRTPRTLAGLLVALFAAGTLLGCPEKGPAEKAGEKIDEAVEDIGNAVD